MLHSESKMAACAEKNLTGEEDFDEDVVFENSPLYQHLQDVGQLDFEVGTTTSKCKRDTESLTGAPGYQAWFKGVVMSVLGNILGFLLQVGTFPKRVLAEVERGYVKQYVSLLVQSKLLLDDDHHFLQLYDPDTYSGDDTDTNWFLSTDTLKLEQFSTHFGAAVVLAIALFLQQNYWLVVTLLILPGALCLTGWFALFIRRHHEHKSTVTLLRTWLVEGEKCVTLARKSFRHIQERELVARGFTMVHGQVPLERMIHSRLWQSQQQCASLRATLVRVTSDMIQQHRKAVLQLLQDYPLNSEVDNTNSYISVIPLQELTNQLLNDTSQVEVNDDNSSLKSLKNLVQLQADQVSEFVRRFALGFSPSTHRTSEPIHGQDVISSFKETLQKLGEVSESRAKVLEKQYDFQTKYGVAKEQEKMLRPENSPLVGLHTAIHSLGLHLQVTMSRVSSIEGSICAAMDAPQQDWTELQQEVTQQLQEVETQLQACKECWEEGSKQLHNLDDNTTDAARSHVDSDSESEKPIDSRTVEDVISVLLVSADANDVIGDPLIEEQVFEAYINEEHNAVDGDGYDPLLTPEEREQQKKERAEAKKMVRELKNVLTVRKQERERKNKTEDEEAEETVNNHPNVLSEPTEKKKTEDVVNDGSLRQQLEVPEQDDVLRRYSPVMSDVYGSGRRSKSSSFDEEDTDLTDRARLVRQDNESHLYNTSEAGRRNHYEVNGGVEVDCIPNSKLVNGNVEQVGRGACNGTDGRNGQNQDDIVVEDRCRKSGYARLSEGSSEEGCVQAGLGGYSFQASLAAQAVARSRQLGLGAAMLQEQSFGDEETFGSDSDDSGD